MIKSKDKNCISRKELTTSVNPKTTRDHNEPELKKTLLKNSLPLFVRRRLNKDGFSAKLLLGKPRALAHRVLL